MSMKNEPKTYRVLRDIVLSQNRQAYGPGAIVDLSFMTDKQRRHWIDQGYFEAADGEPANEPAAPVQPCKNC